jgi:hypothetical protein
MRALTGQQLEQLFDARFSDKSGRVGVRLGLPTALEAGAPTAHGLRAGMPGEAVPESCLPRFQLQMTPHLRKPVRLRQFARKRAITCSNVGRRR